ncbi:hypothetical protein [Sabulicella rubraurantiaca]|uniref:hypothetical protein n=1 Tax=Sabulicella rubraurantiaca TaxID=2811429 RepID=UPI001A965E0F|nr:hypothetical protein [Sabulicella rubraurantiaca]
MSLKIPDWLDVALKVIATLIAIFGVWSFFAQRAEAVRVAREERTLACIARFGGTDIVAARTALLNFWRRYPTFAAEARSRALSPREYEGFVTAAYPNDAARGEVDAALIRLLAFYDEIAFCHRAGTCDRAILLGYFCSYVTQHARVYRPFHALLAAAIGADGLDRHLDELTRSCPS